MIRQWEKRIDRAESHEQLSEIQAEWKEKGRLYKPTEWPVVWGAMAARKMILNGDDPLGEPF
jgi:hypothetical protein